jgi:hypothetical protein
MPHNLQDCYRDPIGREGSRVGLAAIVLAGILVGSVIAAPPARARDGDGYQVDHQGVYLTQRIGQCMNRTGPCYFGGQCPGGEYTSNAYANGRVYCSTFAPPRPYPPSLFESVFGIR